MFCVSKPLTKGLFYLGIRTAHHFKLKWQLENVEQLAKSWEKMFYINTCAYKLAEGHKLCAQGQNLLGTANQGDEKIATGVLQGGCLLKPLATRSQQRKAELSLSTASPEAGAISDKSTKFREG